MCFPLPASRNAAPGLSQGDGLRGAVPATAKTGRLKRGEVSGSGRKAVTIREHGKGELGLQGRRRPRAAPEWKACRTASRSGPLSPDSFWVRTSDPVSLVADVVGLGSKTQQGKWTAEIIVFGDS